jgi:type II secretory pathway component PulF
MRRPCDRCGKAYEAQRHTSKYCSTNCRVQASKQRTQQGSNVVVLPGGNTNGNRTDPPETKPDRRKDTALVKATRKQLTEAGAAETVLGQQALELAKRLSSGTAFDSAVASMSKEFREVMAQALAAAETDDDVLVELRAWRERRDSG